MSTKHIELSQKHFFKGCFLDVDKRREIQSPNSKTDVFKMLGVSVVIKKKSDKAGLINRGNKSKRIYPKLFKELFPNDGATFHNLNCVKVIFVNSG